LIAFDDTIAFNMTKGARSNTEHQTKQQSQTLQQMRNRGGHQITLEKDNDQEKEYIEKLVFDSTYVVGKVQFLISLEFAGHIGRVWQPQKLF
jgi:hypothetical protein